MLENKILSFQPVRDEDNLRFIPYCDFGFHQGVICTSDKYSECEQRRCKHYYRLYISHGTCIGRADPQVARSYS